MTIFANCGQCFRVRSPAFFSISCWLKSQTSVNICLSYNPVMVLNPTPLMLLNAAIERSTLFLSGRGCSLFGILLRFQGDRLLNYYSLILRPKMMGGI